MKVSVVITVKNKAEPVGPLLESLRRQSKKPDEIIVKAGGNRSQGRNAGIRAAKNEIIAVTDAGCTADKYWLERLVKPFKDKKIISVAGYYRPIAKSAFQKSVAPFVAVLPEKFNPKTYLPSSRSIAFRKGAAWYPENLNYCEDLIFARNLKAAGKMAVAKNAIVHWQLVETWRQFFWQIYHYAQGDVRARYQPHLIRIATVFARYAIFALYPPLFLVYLFWVALIKKASILVQLAADSAVMAGCLSGIISRE